MNIREKFKSELNPGDIAYYEISPGLIVPVKIIEVETWFGVNDKAYQYTKNEREEYIDGGTLDLLDQATSIGYTFYWIDEFIGHSLELNYDGFYKTLNDAFKNANSVTKKLAKRRHKKVAKIRKRMIYWLNKSRLKSNWPEIPNWKKRLDLLNEKPIYVKRGRPIYDMVSKNK